MGRSYAGFNNILYPLVRLYLIKILRTLSVAFMLLLITNCYVLHAQTTPSREYQLKAVFLFNFAQFADWPASSFETRETPLVIGILGKNPFGSYLEENISGEKVNEHPVVIQYYKDADEMKACHILFINLPDSKKRKQVIEAVKGKNVLTVSDAPDFLQQGGIIRFITRDNKIKLQINLEASKAADLALSSKLLRLAEIFDSKEKN